MAVQFKTTKFSRQGRANSFRTTRHAAWTLARRGDENRQRRQAVSALRFAVIGTSAFMAGRNQPETKFNEITARQRHSMR